MKLIKLLSHHVPMKSFNSGPIKPIISLNMLDKVDIHVGRKTC
jgi:hypothetical protein